MTDGSSFAANSAVILQRRWECVLCPALPGILSPLADATSEWGAATLGLGLPLETFQLDDTALQVSSDSLRGMVVALRPAILTTAGDVPALTDISRMSKVLEVVPRSF